MTVTKISDKQMVVNQNISETIPLAETRTNFGGSRAGCSASAVEEPAMFCMVTRACAAITALGYVMNRCTNRLMRALLPV